MPDISMCCCEECEKKDSCYRVQATPSKHQSWSDFTNLCRKTNYKYYIETRENNVYNM